jgi:NAD(P)-dependent dehydrogenase (short-subunit alcohol dehydrogenase family)
MSGRVAIVVGAGGELGQVTATRLAADGFTVVGIDRKEAKTDFRYEVGDPTDPDAVRDLIERAGPADVLVNTIGTYTWAAWTR